MKKFQFLSDFEWSLMKIVWEKKEATVKEVWQRAFPAEEKAYTTVQTYMERMVEKGLLKKRKLGLVNFYSARISQQVLMKKSTETLADRIFNGSIGQFAAFLLKDCQLSEKELEEIKKLINEKEDEQ
ncbi:BlaI/MecI/CopY family transcriptional regulator [candidate division KSB1 bacterium]|nr:BlaI/MecI/CopY family transcriptional regulator [candidate division KSB1 bacterium]